MTAFSALVSAGDSRGASKALRTRLLPATAEADAGIAALTSFNAEQQHRLGIEIPRERRRAARVGFMLQLLTGLLGLLLTGLVVLGTRRYTRARPGTAPRRRRSGAEHRRVRLEAGIDHRILRRHRRSDHLRGRSPEGVAAHRGRGAHGGRRAVRRRRLRDRSRSTVRAVDLVRYAGERHHRAGPGAASGWVVGGGRPRWAIDPRLRRHATSAVPRASEGAPPAGIVHGRAHRSQRPERGQPLPGA